MHFTLLGPRLQVASPQLSMHGSNILMDGESACGCGRPYALLGRFSDGFGLSGFPAKSTLALVAILFGFHRLKRLFDFSFHLPERLSDLDPVFRLPVFFITEHCPGEHCDLPS